MNFENNDTEGSTSNNQLCKSTDNKFSSNNMRYNNYKIFPLLI